MSDSEITTNPPGALGYWQELQSGSCDALLKAAAEVDATSPAAVQRLRADWPAQHVQLALELATARAKACDKFGAVLAQQLWCDAIGVEQATSRIVAEHKAKRLASLQPKQIFDLCCGIGGDAMSLARIAPTVAVDRSAVRAWMAGQNAQCDSQCGDVRDVDVADVIVHIDPDRRAVADGRRRRAWRFSEYEPGPEYVSALIAHAEAAAVKLGPGVDFEQLPADGGNEIELISEHGRLVQAVLWTGAAARSPGQQCATMLPAGATFTGPADQPIQTDAIGNYVFTIDPTIERAGLLGAFARDRTLAAVHAKVGLLTADKPHDDVFLTGFRVAAVLPWRVTKVSQWLRGRRAGIVEVKTRGGIVNTDVMQRKLRGEGDTPFTVFVLRMDHKVFAIICQRPER